MSLIMEIRLRKGQGPFYSRGGSAPSCYAVSACLCRALEVPCCAGPSSSHASCHPLLRVIGPAELGEDRNGRDGSFLVLIKHVPVLGYITSKEDIWRRSLGINVPRDQDNCRKHLELSRGKEQHRPLSSPELRPLGIQQYAGARVASQSVRPAGRC